MKNGNPRLKDVYDLVYDNVIPMREKIATIEANTTTIEKELDNIKEHCKEVCKASENKISTLAKEVSKKISKKALATWLSLTTAFITISTFLLVHYLRG
jgi:hypothetical protein